MKNKIIANLTHCNEVCYFGVDFSGSHLRLLQIRPLKNGYDVDGWAQKKIPRGVIEQGKIVKKDIFIDIFKETLEGAFGDFSSKGVMLTIPEEKVFTRTIEVPLVDDEKSLRETIKWETESSIPVSINDIYYDWELIEKNKEKMSVLVMATAKEIVDNYIDVFESLNLKVLALEPESLSMARSLIEDDSDDYTLLVDLGDNSSNFAICRKNLPVFTSSSSISGRMITEVVVKELGISFEKAERYKIKKGLEDVRAGKTKGKSIFEPIVVELISEIKKTADFLKDNLFLEEKIKKIKKTIICGGGSNLKGISSYLTVKLKEPVSQSNPWLNFNFVKKIPPISKQKSQGFAPAIGLTLRSKNKKKQINLLPFEKQESIKMDNFNRFLLKIGLTGVFAIVLFLVFLGANLFILSIYEKANQAEIAQDKNGGVSSVIKETKSEIDSQHSKTSQSIKVIKRRAPYWDYLDQINKLLPEGVYYTEIVMQGEEIKLEGLAEGRDDVVEFREVLEKVEIFKKVEMPISNFTSQENVNFETIISLSEK